MARVGLCGLCAHCDRHTHPNLPRAPAVTPAFHTRTDTRSFTLKAQNSRERGKLLADSHRTAGTPIDVGEDNLGNF